MASSIERTPANWKLEYEKAALSDPNLAVLMMEADRKIQAVLNATIEGEGRDIVEQQLMEMVATLGLGSFISGWKEGYGECAGDFTSRVERLKAAYLKGVRFNVMLAGALLAAMVVWLVS